jgi:ABC-type polysaccharide/polyol phosphate export permease
VTQVIERPDGGLLEPAGPIPPLTSVGRPSLWSSRELIINLTRRQVSGKYKRTTLGHLWSLINPLATMLVYTLVFSVILGSGRVNGSPSGLHVYALFLMCALLPWTFFSGCLTQGMTALINDANLVKKVYFRRDVLVSSTVASLVVTFGFELVVLVGAILAFGGMPLPWIPLVVGMVLILAVLSLGVALLLAVMNVYFRDTEHFLNILLSLWFYLTPIVYPFSRVAKHLNHKVAGVKLSTIYDLNPMTRFVDVFRALLYDNRFPAWGDVTYCAVIAVVMLAIGSYVFGRFEGRLAEEL